MILFHAQRSSRPQMDGKINAVHGSVVVTWMIHCEDQICERLSLKDCLNVSSAYMIPANPWPQTKQIRMVWCWFDSVYERNLGRMTQPRPLEKTVRRAPQERLGILYMPLNTKDWASYIYLTGPSAVCSVEKLKTFCCYGGWTQGHSERSKLVVSQ